MMWELPVKCVHLCAVFVSWEQRLSLLHSESGYVIFTHVINESCTKIHSWHYF